MSDSEPSSKRECTKETCGRHDRHEKVFRLMIPAELLSSRKRHAKSSRRRNLSTGLGWSAACCAHIEILGIMEASLGNGGAIYESKVSHNTFALEHVD